MSLENFKSKCFITLDLEDFCFDLTHNLGIEKSPDVSQLLWTAVENLQSLLETSSSKKITIFSTGVLAKLNPSLIKHLSDFGHEIALHNYFHEDVSKMSIKNLRTSIIEGKSTIEKITGCEVLGFRAPRFSLQKNDKKCLKLLSQNFNYDSSINVTNRNELSEWSNTMKLDLIEVPVLKMRIFFDLLFIKLGGSYTKLLPKDYFMKHMRQLALISDLPMVFYLHPYDLLNDRNFHLPFTYTKKLPLHSRIYWHFRQKQWNYLGNRNVLKKWNSIIKTFGNSGCLKDNLKLWK